MLELKSHNLALDLIATLKERNLTITCAESCTGGLLSYAFASISGVSKVFVGSIVSYSNECKMKVLGVKRKTLEQHGAVSQEVVEQMCRGVLKISKANLAIATSGIAGPDGGSAEKPVGLVYVGVQKKGCKAMVKKYNFAGSRTEIQKQAVIEALNLAKSKIL